MQEFNSIIEQAKALGHQVEIISHIKSGKEASVFRVLLNGELVAMKMYKSPGERSFKNDDSYLAGKFYKTASERRAVAKKNKFGRALKYDNWIKREFFLLQKFYEAGASLPRPIIQIGNAVFMQLLGDRDEIAPRLVDVELTADEAARAFETILSAVKIFYDLGVVHGDLSAYNILWWESRPYIIDFPQSIDVRLNPDAHSVLVRDLENVMSYFNRYFTVDRTKIFSQFD